MECENIIKMPFILDPDKGGKKKNENQFYANAGIQICLV
jgi:hypothetical protein